MPNLYQSFDTESRFWLSNLNNYNEAPFLKKHVKTNQSAQDVYQEVFGESLQCIENIKLCTQQVNTSTKIGKKSFAGRILFSVGTPKRKKRQNFPTLVLSDILTTQNTVYKLMKEAERLSGILRGIKGKVQHADYGYLSAEEWYKLIIITLKSNKKRINTINKMFI